MNLKTRIDKLESESVPPVDIAKAIRNARRNPRPPIPLGDSKHPLAKRITEARARVGWQPFGAATEEATP